MMFYVSIVISLLFVLSLQAWSFIPGVIAVILFFSSNKHLTSQTAHHAPFFPELSCSKMQTPILTPHRNQMRCGDLMPPAPASPLRSSPPPNGSHSVEESQPLLYYQVSSSSKQRKATGSVSSMTQWNQPSVVGVLSVV